MLPDRLLIIGWDAADWQIIHQRLAAGGMPHLRELMRRGCHAPLATLEPRLSPLLWTSIATGVTADRHGILHFIEPDPAGGPLRVSSSTTRRTKALWNLLTQAGQRTHAVNWYASHPAEPINGSVVTNLFMEGSENGDPMPAQSVWPPEWADRIAPCRVAPAAVPEADLTALVPAWKDHLSPSDPRIALLRGHLARLRSVHAAGLAALTDGKPWNCTLIFQEAIDTIGHHFMPFHPPKMAHVTEADFRYFNGVMTGLYELHDQMLGDLLAAAGPQTNVLLLSDHGFHSDGQRPVTEGLTAEERAATEALWHREHGILVLAGPGILPQATLRQPGLLDITPTALALLGCPAGADMDGRVLAEALVAPAPAPIPSWETMDGGAGLHPPELRQDPFDASGAIQQLIALGYLAALPEGREAQLDLVRRETQFNLAMVHASRGRPALAAALLGPLANTHPQEPRYVFNLVTSLLNLARPGPAIDALEAFLKFEPQHPDALQQLAAAYLADTRTDDARALLAAPPPPEWTACHRAHRLGELHLLAGHLPTARSMFQLALTRDPADAAALTGLAKVEIAESRFEEAAGHCLDALELHPYHAEAHHQLGAALAWLGSLDQAVMSFHSALALQPGRLETLRFLEAVLPPATSAVESLLLAHDFDPAQRAILLRDHPMGSAAWASRPSP